MAIINFDNVGSIGIIKDTPSYELPAGAWSDAGNVRFQDGKVEKFLGDQQIYEVSASVTESLAVDPWFVLPVNQGDNFFWIYASRNKVYAADTNAPNNDITRTSGDYSATSNTRWSGGILGGIPIINNGVDAPQMWTPVALGTPLQDLTYDQSAGTTWTDANLTAKVVKPYKSYLVALDVTKSATRFPRLVKWSHPAASGAVPNSWDETDATKDAGEQELAETNGFLIDCLPLRDTNMIYKEDSIIGQQIIGGKLVFRFYTIFRTIGAIAENCVAEVYGQHVVFGRGDIIIHNGQSAQSLLDKKLRSFLYNSIDPDQMDNCYVARNFSRRELWFCYPENGQAVAFFPQKALVWNWKDNTFTIRDLPGASHANWGTVQQVSNVRTWDQQAGVAWTVIPGPWGQRLPAALVPKLVMARPDSTSAASVKKLLVVDETEQFDGANFISYVQREGLGFRPGADGSPRPDKENFKYIRSVWPRIEANTGTKVNIRIGRQDHENDPVVWTDPLTYTVGDSIKVDTRVTTRLPAIWFENTDGNNWKLLGYALDIDLAGRY